MSAARRLALAALAFSSIAYDAHAEPTLAKALSTEARPAYDAARVLFDDGDFDGAYVKFLAAYEASHDARLLWNMALSEKNLRHYAAALRLVARYLDEATAHLSREDVREAHALSASIEPFTATATIQVSEPGAEIVLDDAPLGTSPLPSSIVVDLGVRRLRVTKPGFRPYVAAVPVGGRRSVAFDVKLTRAEGHLTIDAPAEAEITIDGERARAGGHKVDLELASGSHLIRATAPGRRAFQTEVTLGDHEARTLSISLEPLGSPARREPEIQVAVGCGGRAALAPDQGLRVYFDGGTASEALSRVRRRWDNQRQAEVVDFAAYPVDAGRHEVSIRAPGCVSARASVVVPEDRPAHLVGALAPDSSVLARGPAGLAEGWGVAVGAWGGWARFDQLTFDTSRSSSSATVPLGGVVVSAETVARFFGFALDARFGYGRATDDAGGAVTLSKLQLGARFGPRLPLAFATLAGGGIGALHLDVLAPRSSASSVEGGVTVAWWAALSIVPVCDWSGEAMISRGAITGGSGQSADLAVSLSLGYRPGDACHDARGVAWGVHQAP